MSSLSPEERRQITQSAIQAGWLQDRLDALNRYLSDPDREEMRSMVVALTSSTIEMQEWRPVIGKAMDVLDRLATVEERRVKIEEEKASLWKTVLGPSGVVIAIGTAVLSVAAAYFGVRGE